MHSSTCQAHIKQSFSAPGARAFQPIRPQSFLKPRPRHAAASRVAVKAGLPDGNSLAVLQQGSAFAILIVAEGIYTRTQMEENSPGRPSILPIFAGVTGLVAALVLLKLEQGEWLGLIVGGVVSGLLLALNIKRSFDTSSASSEWPGPKVWPIFVSTGAFFSMLAFLESFQYLSY